MSTNDGRIISTAEYGQQIELACRNHPELRWSTKNIDSIGCRHIFYVTIGKPECSCPIRDLYPIK